MIVLWWKRRKEARAQVDAARGALEDARSQAEETKRAVRPIKEAYERNMFSDMIRDALSVGYGREDR